MNNIKEPLVSIIIANFNNEKYISKCLDSCIEQTYKNIEIIVVDDASFDNSINIIKEYMRKFRRIKLIRNKKNLGVSKTRNIGIEQSKGIFISTLDSDDFFYSRDKIEKELKLLKRFNFNENVIAFSDIVLVNEKGEPISKVSSFKKVLEGEIFNCILTRSCFIPRDFLLSKRLLKKVGGYDEKLSLYEDWDLKIRLSKVSKFFYTRNLGVAYRQHNKGLSSSKKKEHIKAINYVFNKNTKFLDKEHRDSLRKQLNKNIYPGIIQKFINFFKRKFS